MNRAAIRIPGQGTNSRQHATTDDYDEDNDEGFLPFQDLPFSNPASSRQLPYQSSQTQAMSTCGDDDQQLSIRKHFDSIGVTRDRARHSNLGDRHPLLCRRPPPSQMPSPPSFSSTSSSSRTSSSSSVVVWGENPMDPIDDDFSDIDHPQNCKSSRAHAAACANDNAADTTDAVVSACTTHHTLNTTTISIEADHDDDVEFIPETPMDDDDAAADVETTQPLCYNDNPQSGTSVSMSAYNRQYASHLLPLRKLQIPLAALVRVRDDDDDDADSCVHQGALSSAATLPTTRMLSSHHQHHASSASKLQIRPQQQQQINLRPSNGLSKLRSVSESYLDNLRKTLYDTRVEREMCLRKIKLLQEQLKSHDRDLAMMEEASSVVLRLAQSGEF